MIRMGRGSKQEPENEEKQIQQTPVTNYGQQNYQNYEQQYRSSVVESNTSISRAMTDSETIARSIKEGTMSGFVGFGTSLSGEVTFKAMWRIDGQFSGRVVSEDGTLIIGNSGQVDANVEVAVATVNGTVNGDIIATQRIELGRTARVNGNIQTPSLLIEQGAIFDGNCRMIQAVAAAEKQQAAIYESAREPVTHSSYSTPVETTTEETEDVIAAEATN